MHSLPGVIKDQDASHQEYSNLTVQLYLTFLHYGWKKILKIKIVAVSKFSFVGKRFFEVLYSKGTEHSLQPDN